MSDEHGRDAKIVAVPISDIRGRSLSDVNDLDPHLKNEIQHFFAVYKDLEPGKHSEVSGFGSAAEAEEEIRRSLDRARRPQADD